MRKPCTLHQRTTSLLTLRPVFHPLRRRYITIVLIRLSQLSLIKKCETTFLPISSSAV
jgi:hypothetical protein